MSASLPRFGLVLLLACGCASSTPTPRESSAHASEWLSPLYREHPLVGKIWDVRQGRWVQRPALEAELTRTRFVLLGERHDNADHHRLQARLVEALSASGRKPTLAFEMLDVEQQPAVDASLAQAPKDADALARAVVWEHSGWPAWALYRPVFATPRGSLPMTFASCSAPGRCSTPLGTTNISPRSSAPRSACSTRRRRRVTVAICGVKTWYLPRPAALAA